MATYDTFDDSLTINIDQQIRLLAEELSESPSHISALQNASSRSELLKQLSHYVATPGLSEITARLFKPMLLDLCARWLEEETELDEKFEAFALLLEIHPEIFPVFHRLLSHPYFTNGPLGFLRDIKPLTSVDAVKLHRTLLAYYRILHANSELSRTSCWSLALLSRIIWERHPDPGVRFLAIRCYALQSGMMEGERVKMEKEVLGEVQDVDCPVTWDAAVDGSRAVVDGWILPIQETRRVLEARKALPPPQKYFTYEDGNSVEPIHPAELSPLIANVYGVLMLRSSHLPSSNSLLVPTPTATKALRALAAHLIPNVPTLLTSAASSGKALFLSHLASILYPDRSNQIVTIHLADTSLDPRSLLGSYISSPTHPGTFEWKEGVLVKAMREGRWVVFEDIDRGSNEVLGLIKPLVESLGLEKWIGGQAEMEVPSRGLVRAASGFSIFATRSIQLTREDKFPSPTFFGSHKFFEVIIDSPTHDDLRAIVDARFPRLAGPVGGGLVQVWDAARQLGKTASSRDIGVRELEKLCARVDKLLPPSYQPMEVDFDNSRPPSLSSLFPNSTIREDIFFECRDVFFGSGATTAGAQMHLTAISSSIAEQLGLSEERRDWVLGGRSPDYIVNKDVNGVVTSVTLGRTRLAAMPTKPGAALPATRSFAMHKPAICLLSRIASAISLYEPILLTGETGTGKTSVVTHLASLLRQPLISLNLSNQTEASDIVGGFKPVDARVPATELYERFLDLFGRTFSRKKNAHFEESVRKAVQDGKWKRAVGLWSECIRLAKDRIQAKLLEDSKQSAESDAPRKRRKTENGDLNVSEQSWLEFERDVQTFDIQHVQGNGKFAFAFMEGPLVKALRLGHWILLDEINLASAETLECVSSLLHGPTASITLTEQGSLEPVPRHPNFRLFACMNPATDVGKKDLPPNIRSRFTEIDVPPPDADRETLLSIVSHYIGPYAVSDKGAIMDVAEFYSSVRTLAGNREIADGSNHKPHFSMRTLARALTFAADLSSTYSLRRALWEGCLMAFTMALDSASAPKVTALVQRHILAGVKNPRSLLMKEPLPPQGRSIDEFIKFGPFYLERGPLPEDTADEYIITPSVETKLIDLARIIVTRRFPVLIEGPTSSGKTSSIEYLAKRTGHRFVRINNHEHTDIQEYLGTYVSDPATGKLVFKDGLLVRALRNGDWIVLDELNLAPTDVLEALNRLLDDNRELIVPETQEVIRPHPHFMLFATQNPPGLYGGRKVLSRAFRNRFLEVHFEDVPQGELETILCQRCRIAPSYGQRIVEVFQELQKYRQSGRIFESKHGFATLRDLFRWAGRDAMSYQELADNGYMLLAERARREEDKNIVKEVLESVMKVSIDPERLYNLEGSDADVAAYLGISLPTESSLVWTSGMKRLFTLVARALRFNEPLLLVGETGCGKTSVCQVFAEITGRQLHAVNCHQNTETADLIGSLRPLRNRAALETEAISGAIGLLQSLGQPIPDSADVAATTSAIDNLISTITVDNPSFQIVRSTSSKLHRLSALFEWHDGPLVHAMRSGDVFLMDEISLADDSVLERLNSVLEPGRTIVLAEQGGAEELPAVRAADEFKLVATMNPGGDFGKKELSPALRNRFTEIWVPAVDSRSDLELIVQRSWRHNALQQFTTALLDFTEWLAGRIGDRSVVTLRDILAWVEFVNVTYEPDLDNAHINMIFHHAAHMTFLDGLGSLPQLSAYSATALADLKKEAVSRLDRLFPAPKQYGKAKVVETDSTRIQLGSFSIPRGSVASNPSAFSLQAPTTQDNVGRVVRACQLVKPILLEGSPGVGKTSLVAALANICGHHLCRINLSDQTDLVDLFGSDLPVEGGTPGQFAWKDADFLRALQEGHWVLLDEMNLAPQAVLEGLNAVLDHRGTVYIPELGRSFVRHPSFRIFAAQNPLHQGGGRKGLPKSFLNRFTKVYVQELTAEDTQMICRSMFPAIPPTDLDGMISFTTRLHEEAMVKRTFAREGAPWEFNLRDILRWGSLIQQAMPSHLHPVAFLDILFLQRFRSHSDRDFARSLFYSVFPGVVNQDDYNPAPIVSSHCLQVGRSVNSRCGRILNIRPTPMLHAHLQAYQALGTCIANGWLAILTGQRNTGKNWVVRQMAHLTGHTLHEIAINSATDASDLLGSFEEVDARTRLRSVCRSILGSLSHMTAFLDGSQLVEIMELRDNIHSSLTRGSDQDWQDIAVKASYLKAELDRYLPDKLTSVKTALESLSVSHGGSAFEWVDGPLVRALKAGDWVLLDSANLCSPSVLDRLNALCESNGTLTLNEKGAVNGMTETVAPHASFRLFMTADHHFGELSRAMRNRGVEIALVNSARPRDLHILHEFLRMSDYMHLSRRDAFRTILPLEDQSIHAGVSARLLPEDSVASSISDLTTSVFESTSIPFPEAADAYVVSYAISPSHLHLVRRLLLPSADHNARVVAILDTMANLAHPHITEEVMRVRETLARDLEVPRDHLLSQSLDLGLYPGVPLQPTSSVRALLQVVAASTTFPPMLRQTPSKTSTLRSEDRTRDTIVNLASAVQYAASSIYQHIEITSANAEGSLSLMVRLLSYVSYLSRANGEERLDHSAVYAASSWLNDALEEHDSEFATVQTLSKVLSEAIALTSGQGLIELWSSLSTPAIEDIPASKIDTLVAVAHALPCELAGLRRKVFDLISLLASSSVMSSDKEQTILSLTNHLQSQLPDLWSQATRKEEEYRVHPTYLIAELSVISRLRTLQSSQSESFRQGAASLIELAVQDYECDMAQFVEYQQALWLHDIKQMSPRTMFTMQKHWLESIWAETQVQELNGPSILLAPTILLTTFSQCDHAGQTLQRLPYEEQALKRHFRTLVVISATHQARLYELQSMLLQLLITVFSCFRETFDDDDTVYVRTLFVPVRTPLEDELAAVIGILRRSRHTGLRLAVSKHLIPVLPHHDEVSVHKPYTEHGKLWIGLSQLLLHLFVPNIPIDPSALQSCALQFESEQRALLEAQIAMLRDFVERTQGNSSSETIRYLQARTEAITTTSTSISSSIHISESRKDLGRLHTYWAEVQQFIAQVLSESKLSILLNVVSEDSSTSARESVVQASIETFCRRLSTAYPDFQDINALLQVALHAFKLGLRLVVADTSSSEQTSLSIPSATIEELTAFPSVSSAELLCGLADERGVTATVSTVLTRLSAVAYEIALGGEIGKHMEDIAVLYEQVYGLWSIDRAREADKEREAQSLYRKHEEDPTDADFEEQDFLTIFPEFGDLLDDSGADNRVPGAKSLDLVSSTFIWSLVQVHDELFGSSRLSLPQVASRFEGQRRMVVETVVKSNYPQLSERLDALSLPFQLRLTHDKMESLLRAPFSRARPYDFYLDENVPETRKAIDLVQSLVHRIDLLLRQWPDQMVLHHLKSRCEAVLKLSFRSPVAKILSALEQLLPNIEDWEMYANRENSLRAEQQTLISLIVSWRRLELLAWQGLLDRQAVDFASSTSEWWFKLYDATIRGVMSLAEAEAEDPSGMTNFFNDLVPLLDEFITSSAVGQFSARLSLLRSMELYADKLADFESGYKAAGLRRVHRILHATRMYYSQFNAKVSESLATQRSALEKEVQGFIKLASWKDVNIHALRQSAQKTHRQLYKVIRKFRDVLRQPTSPILTRHSSDTPPQSPKSITNPSPSPSTNIPSFPSAVSTASAPHLLNLPRTYHNFITITQQRIPECFSAHSSQSVDSLAQDILTTSQALANESIPNSLESSKRQKLAKNLLTRKRKAWSDFSKEFKRAGIPSSVKAEILRQQSSQSWLREQPALLVFKWSVPNVLQADDYFYHLFSEMPTLRSSLANHHDDIITQDLQRAVLHAESALTIAIRSRTSMANASSRFATIVQLIQRLTMVRGSPIIVASGKHVEEVVLFVKEMAPRLVDALQEVSEAVRIVQSTVESFDAPADVLEQLEDIVRHLQELIPSIDTVWGNVHLSNNLLLLKDEEAIVGNVMQQVDAVSDRLRAWLSEYPHLCLFLEPVLSWMTSKVLPCTPPSSSSSPSTPLDDYVIDTLLLAVQNLLAVCPSSEASADGEAEHDYYIRDGSNFLCKVSDALGLDSLLDSLERLISDLPHAPEDVIRTCLDRVLPFLDQYAWLARSHIENQASWTRALFKLNHIICSIALTVAKDGFCQPKDVEESGGDAGGDGKEMVDGSGMGEGTGQENVSKDIQDESQVEGLQGDDAEKDEKVERAEEGNAIEMSEDFGGELQDVLEDDEGEGEEDEDEGSEVDAEERQEQLDASDEDAVDEKLWGDEQGPDSEQSGKTDKDHSTQNAGQSDVIAKEDESTAKSNDKDKEAEQEEKSDQPREDVVEDEVAEEVRQDEPNGPEGAPLDEHMQDADTLDLPETLQLEEDQAGREEGTGDIEDDLMSEDEEEANQRQEGHGDDEDDHMSDIEEGEAHATSEDAGETGQGDEEMDTAVAEADTHAGDGAGSGEKSQPEDAIASATTEPQVGGSGSTGEQGGQEGDGDQNEEMDNSDEGDAGAPPEPVDAPASSAVHEMSSSGDATGTQRTGAQSAAQARSQSEMPNPLRSLGDALKEVAQRVSEILDNMDGPDLPAPTPTEDKAAAQLEYVKEDDAQTDMQALGPAHQDEVAKLRDLNIVDDGQEQTGIQDGDDMQVDEPEAVENSHLSSLKAEQQTSEHLTGIDSVLTPADIHSHQPSTSAAAYPPAILPETQLTEAHGDLGSMTELAVRKWQSLGAPSEDAMHIWRLYDTLTSSLSHSLCEQLRLILEPTQATRLKGDYRTGKRLNMKKIIPYVASEYTKDKIWLRRTRPSKREYQVLVALDDSKSMAEGKSIHLAFQTLAIVCKALSRLEVGEVAVAKFGQSVDVLHNGFESLAGGGEPFTDQAGAKIVNAFRFDQKATQILSLLEASLGILEQARERRASATAADLWQLEIIISDGICQDHEKLRTILRRAQEQRVMVVFIILDSLHSHVASGPTTDAPATQNQNSILSMNQVAYKDVNGRMELTVSRYLDSFPFEYYVVVRDVEALPEVLAGTLKQFFERVSEE